MTDGRLEPSAWNQPVLHEELGACHEWEQGGVELRTTQPRFPGLRRGFERVAIRVWRVLAVVTPVAIQRTRFEQSPPASRNQPAEQIDALAALPRPLLPSACVIEGLRAEQRDSLRGWR